MQDYEALIMVVDDNPDFLTGIEMTLEMQGFEVWKAKNGQHALDELRSSFEDPEKARLPDLIIADIMMPVMDGYEFYERVQTNPYLDEIPFIFLTAKSDTEDIRRGKSLGIDDYIPKFSETEDILASIRGKLKRKDSLRGKSLPQAKPDTSSSIDNEEDETVAEEFLGLKKKDLIIILTVAFITLMTAFWLWSNIIAKFLE